MPILSESNKLQDDTMPQQLPHTTLYTAAQVRKLDRIAIEEKAIAGIQLMKRAGRAVFNTLIARWPIPTKVTVLCGVGNNAGDGYIVAALAAQRRLPVEVIQVGEANKLKGDALTAYQYALQQQVPMSPWGGHLHCSEGLLVDALLGTGLQGEVRSPFAYAIEAMNQSNLPILSVDIPSGLCADTGRILGSAVRADVTVTLIGRKRGLFTARAAECCGELMFDQLQVPVDIYNKVGLGVELLQWQNLLTYMPIRHADAHKGDFGHVMVIGGDVGYGGAAIMAAETAARLGAGLVSLATRPEHVTAMLGRRPEVMTTGVTSGQALESILQTPTVLVIGPGLGRSSWSEQMLQQAVKSGLPLVMDADALNLLSEGRVINDICRESWLITPHPGEAARLLGCSVAKVQTDRFAAVTALQAKFGGTVVLKGSGSLVASASEQGSSEAVRIGLCADGNSGMASGGMGDVLSGILGALLAQRLSCQEAAQLGVCLHAVAADLAVADSGQRGLLATDLIPYLRELINQD